MLDDRTLTSATTWRTRAFAFAGGAVLVTFCAYTTSVMRFGTLPGLIIGGISIGLMMRSHALRPIGLRARLERTQTWTTVAATLFAVTAVCLSGNALR